jgi:hypothetical protein
MNSPIALRVSDADFCKRIKAGPWPICTINGGQGVRNRVSYHDFADMQRGHKSARNLRIPIVQFQRSNADIVGLSHNALLIGAHARRRERQFDELSLMQCC